MRKTKKTKKVAKANKKLKAAPKKHHAPKHKRKKPAEHYKTVTLINETLSQLEDQAMKAYKSVKAIKRRSTPDWKKWLSQLSKQDWIAIADAQRERVSSEIKDLSQEIVSRINSAEVLHGKNKMVKEAKTSLKKIVEKIDHGTLVDKAVDSAIHTKDGLLAFLNIPTHAEMAGLQKKLKKLEQKMNHMSGKRA